MTITVTGILKTPSGAAIQNAEILFEQGTTSLEIIAGTDHSFLTNTSGAYTSPVGIGNYIIKIRFPEDIYYTTVASNVEVVSSMNGYSINQILKDQSAIEGVDEDILDQCIQARDAAVQQQIDAEASEAMAKNWATKAEDSIVETTLYSSYHYSRKSSASQTLASDWAIKPYNTIVTTGSYSALHHSTLASEWATKPYNTIVNGLTGKYSALHYSALAADYAIKPYNSLVNGIASTYSALHYATLSQKWSNTAEDALVTTAGTYSALHYSSKSSKSQILSQDWAAKAENSVVSGGLYSALHYAAKAAASQTSGSGSQSAAAGSQAAAATSQTNAATSEANALIAETNAETAETNAETAETNAAGSQTSASGSQTLAGKWATDPVDTQVTTGKYSAFHHQTKAQTSQTLASDWAIKPYNTIVTVAGTYSSLHYSTLASEWATKAYNSTVNGVAGKYSALHYSSLAADYAVKPYNTLVNGIASTYSALHYATLSQKWSNTAEDTIVTTTGTYSALHYSAKAAASQTAASSSQTAAATSQTNAASSATAASGSATAASGSATAAAGSQTTAQKWAANPENTVVSGGLYSALHYAAKAAQSAQTAAGQMIWKGGWSAQAGQAPPTPVSTVDYYRITAAGTILSVAYDIGDYIHWDNISSIWFKMDGTDSVISVNGKSGQVTITLDELSGFYQSKTVLNVDLNTINIPGVYYQTANANATVINNYPEQQAGTLIVTPSAYGTQQQYITFGSANTYQRGLSSSWNGTNGPWGTWKLVSVPINTFMRTVLDDTSATEVRNTIGAYATTGGAITGTVTIEPTGTPGYGLRFTTSGTTVYLQQGKTDKDVADQKLIIGGWSGASLSSFDIVTSSHGIATIKGSKIYTEGYKPTAADVGAEPAGAVAQHVALADPHTQYIKAQDYQPSEPPFPDVWAPLSDSIQLEQGNGTNMVKFEATDTLTMPGINQLEFSRLSTGTYLDKTGVLRTALINEPRFEKEGLLMEGASTNVVTRSESFLASNFGDAWAHTPVSDGWISLSAKTTEVGPPAEPAYADVAGNSQITVNAIQTFSIDIQKTTDLSVKFQTYGPSAGNSAVSITTQTWDSVVPSVGFTITRSSDNTWMRIEYTGTFTSASTRIIRIYPNNGSDFTVRRTLVYRRCQVELLPFATSYIYTNGAQATRSAEICKISWPKNLEPIMTIGNSLTTTMEYDLLGTGQAHAHRCVLQQGSGTGSPGNFILRFNNAQTMMAFYRSSGAVGSADVGTANRKGFCAVRIKPDNQCTYIVNDLVMNNTSAPTGAGTLDYLGLGCTPTGSRQMFGHIRNLRIWNKVLTDAQINRMK